MIFKQPLGFLSHGSFVEADQALNLAALIIFMIGFHLKVVLSHLCAPTSLNDYTLFGYSFKSIFMFDIWYHVFFWVIILDHMF